MKILITLSVLMVSFLTLSITETDITWISDTTASDKYNIVTCPNDYAIKTKTRHYIRCEDYDAYQIGIESGEILSEYHL